MSVSNINDAEIFKKPLKPAPRKRKKVLDEELYIKQLEDIIERDYFPDLDNLKDKLDYLEAHENNDVIKIRELYAKYSFDGTPKVTRPEDSPATFDTPLSTAKDDDSNLKPKENMANTNTSQKSGEESGDTNKIKDVSLDEFMANHTSEDNESFENIMEETRNKFKIKHSWLFEAEEKHNKNYTPNLALPSVEEQKQSKILALTGTSEQDRDIRPKSVENWNYRTFNSVMYVPDHVEASERQKVLNSSKKRREVHSINTRFNECPFDGTVSEASMQEANAIQASKKEGKVGIDGKDLRETPCINGYSFMRSPSPFPGVDQSPLMTWGQVEGTPLQLEGSQTPLIRNKTSTSGPSYKIPKVSDRDKLLLKLAEKASQNNRDRRSKALNAARHTLASPATKFNRKGTSERVVSMSPAAQKLLSKKLCVRQQTDQALRATYTPSPSTQQGTPTSGFRTPISARNNVRTPIRVDKLPSTPASLTNESFDLTANLLKLPTRQSQSSDESVVKRKCAADFF